MAWGTGLNDVVYFDHTDYETLEHKDEYIEDLERTRDILFLQKTAWRKAIFSLAQKAGYSSDQILSLYKSQEEFLNHFIKENGFDALVQSVKENKI